MSCKWFQAGCHWRARQDKKSESKEQARQDLVLDIPEGLDMKTLGLLAGTGLVMLYLIAK